MKIYADEPILNDVSKSEYDSRYWSKDAIMKCIGLEYARYSTEQRISTFLKILEQ